MNWNSHEFIWLDWTILAVGIVAVIWAVWRSVQKDKRSQQGASSEDYLFGFRGIEVHPESGGKRHGH